MNGPRDRKLIEGLINPYLLTRTDSRRLAGIILGARGGNSTSSLEELKSIFMEYLRKSQSGFSSY